MKKLMLSMVALGLLAPQAFAEVQSLTVLPQKGRCPADIRIEETVRQYEGGAETTGKFLSSTLWRNVRIVTATPTLVLFVGDVNTELVENCEAEAALLLTENGIAERVSHYKVRVTNNKIYFKVDISGYGEFARVMASSVESGVPSFRFAVAD